MINISISICFSEVMNNTGIEWYEFQEPLKNAVEKMTLHTFPKSMKIISGPLQYKDDDLYYEIWARVKDSSIEYCIIKTDKQESPLLIK